MDKNNGTKEEPKPPRILVEAKMDLPNGIAYFTEKQVDGVVMIDPKVIAIPIQTIIIMGAQAILAMNGISSGAVKVTKDGAVEQPVSKIITS
jgi:hypothetical protein